jgi:hypothetical protein
MRLAAGGADGLIRLWDVATRKQIGTLAGHTAAITSLARSADGKTLISGSTDRTVRTWDLAARKELRKFTAHEEGVLSLSLTGDNLLLSTGEKKEVLNGGHFIVTGADKPRLWDPATGKELRAYNIEASLAVLSYDRRFLATDGTETKLMGTTLSQRRVFALRDAATGRALVEFKPPSPAWITFSPDGKLLASIDSTQLLLLRETVTGQEIYRLPKWPGSLLVFSADGKWLAAGTAMGEVRFLPLPPGRELRGGQALGADPTRLWDDLANEDAAVARQALWTLATIHEKAVPFLKRTLKRPEAGTDAGRAKQHIADLERKQFTARDAATRALEKLGFEAEIPLRAALDSGKLSLEAKRRVQTLLEALQTRFPLQGEPLRQSRALQLLETIGTAEALTVLRGLAGGPATSTLVQEARRCVERLERLGAAVRTSR